MQYDDFVGHVQNRARLGTRGETVSAIRATLQTLSERICRDEAANLTAQLPQEIGHYLEQADTTERFSLDEFFERVATREQKDLPKAVRHARAVVAVLQETLPVSQFNGVKAQLPIEFQPLFISGSEQQAST